MSRSSLYTPLVVSKFTTPESLINPFVHSPNISCLANTTVGIPNDATQTLCYAHKVYRMELPYPTDVHDWDWDTVTSLESQDETQYLEYKQYLSDPQNHSKDSWRAEIEREITAFANASGGILVFGVDDYGNPSPVPRPEHEIDQSVTQIYQNAVPLPDVDIPDPISPPGGDHVVLPVKIEEATRKPVTTHDSAIYIRVNDRKEPMSREQMQSIFVSNDRQQQNLRKLEMEVRRFYDLVTADDSPFRYMSNTKPPNYGALNLDSLEEALRENTRIYEGEDVVDAIQAVFEKIQTINHLEVRFGREAKGYTDHPYPDRETHWREARNVLNKYIKRLAWELETLIKEADLDVEAKEVDLRSR